MKKLSSAGWLEVGRRIFCSWGASSAVADCVAASLVDSERCGMSSHGILRIPSYYDMWKAGWLNPAALADVTLDGPASATVDAHWGFGQPAMELVMSVAIAKCRTQGIAGVALVHSGHVGRLGAYVESAASAGTIALVTASGGPPGGLVVPYGGAQRVLCTNPIAAGVPAGEHEPFVMDYATSQVAAGKIEWAPDPTQPIPAGWAVDSRGLPARTVGDFLDGGGLVPFGGHKGYALALFIELLCGALTGAGLSERPDNIPSFGAGGNACFAIVIDIAHFRDPDTFGSAVDAFFERLKRVRPAEGSDGVVIPGEPEFRQRALRAEAAISIPDATWEKIQAIAVEQNVVLNDLQ